MGHLAHAHEVFSIFKIVAAEVLKLTGQHRGGHDNLKEATEPPTCSFLFLSRKKRKRIAFTVLGLGSLLLSWQT